jgi:hypothetical protein
MGGTVGGTVGGTAAGAPVLRSLAPAFRYERRYFQISLFASTGWRSAPISLPTEA